MSIHFYYVLRRQDCFTWKHELGCLYSTPDLVSVEIGCSKVKVYQAFAPMTGIVSTSPCMGYKSMGPFLESPGIFSGQ